MANLETVLKIRDQFSNTINKVTSSMRQAAASGGEASGIMSAGMDKVGVVVSRARDHFQGLAEERRSMMREWERENPSALEIKMEDYGRVTGELEYLQQKKTAIYNQTRLVENEVNRLGDAYQRFLSQGDFPNADKTYKSLQQANILMANLGTGAYRVQDQIKALQRKEENIKEEIALCEKEQQKFNRAIQAAGALVKGVQNGFSSIGGAIDNAKQKVGNLFSAIKNKFSGSGNGIGGYLKAFLGMAAVKKGIEGTIGAGAKLQQQINTMAGMFGNADIGKSYFNRLQQYAAESGQNVSDLMATTQQFLSVTKNTDHLMGLNNIAEKLNFKNPDQGADGAAYAINEALSGQYTSLKNRFNLSSAQLEPIKQAVAKGNMEGIIDAFNNTMAMAGITDQVIEGYRQSVPNQVNSILNSFKTGFANAGMGALENLQPILTQIQGWLNSSGADQFFAVIGNGLSMITQAVAWLGQKVSENWAVIQPVLLAMGILAALVGAVMFASWLLSVAPLLLIVAAITGFVIMLQEAGVTAAEIVEFIGGLFGVLASTIGNVFIGIWNIAVDVAEFLNNVFIDPAYAIQKLFLDLGTEVLKVFDNLVQGIVSSINWVIEKINSITGSSLKTVEVNFVSGWIDNLESKKDSLISDKDMVDFSHLKKEYLNGADAFDTGMATGAKLFNTVTDAIGDFSASEANWNATQAGILEGIAGDTGNISNSVDIASEDLKYFRDIAEREAINKITHNTIVPKLEVSFGDIHKDADVDTLLDKLVDRIEEAFDIGPEGIHQ